MIGRSDRGFVCAALSPPPSWQQVALNSGTTAFVGLFSSGYQTAIGGATNFIIPCGNFAAWGSNLVVRVTMGSVTDFYRPLSGNTLCGASRCS